MQEPTIVDRMGAGIIITPGQTAAEMSKADFAISSLVRDVAGSRADDQFRKGLGDFAREWISFRDGQDWWSKGTKGTWDQVQAFIGRYNGWRKRYEAMGGKLTAGPISQDKGLISLPSRNTIAIGLLIVGAGVGLVLLLKN